MWEGGHCCWQWGQTVGGREAPGIESQPAPHRVACSPPHGWGLSTSSLALDWPGGASG